MSKIGSRGGGVGVALDRIRPKGTPINNSAKISDGVAFVMRKFNQTGNSIGQSGRNMAIMVALDCKHPDIYEFLNIKKNDEKLAAMNISIKFTDEFMQAVVDNKEYELYFKLESTGEEIKRTIYAKEFFDEFCEINCQYGDPGCIFIDRVQKYNLLSGYEDYKIDVSNPCAEFFGNAGNSCNLQSINLYNIVENKFSKDACINYDKLKKLVKLSIRMLNETLDYGYDMQPLDINRRCIDDWRSVGLGVFGLADMLIALGIKYGSEKSIYTISDVMDCMNLSALEESCELAKKQGTFKKYDWENTKKSSFIDSVKLVDPILYDNIKKYGLRNGTLLSIAPTGTLSLLAGGFAGGVEPLFKISYERTTHSTEDNGFTFSVVAKSVKDLLAYNNIDESISDTEIKELFPFVVESDEIAYIDRILMQSTMQEYVDNAISSTINLPKGTSADVIKDIYVNAWQQGLKGITVFVDGCKRGNILGASTGDDKEPTNIFKYDSIKPLSRRTADEVSGKTYRLSSACAQKMYVTVNKTDDNDIFEIFVNPTGGCQTNISVITRLVSTMLRSGVSVETIIEDLSTAKCPACQALRNKGNKDISLSCGNAIATALSKAYKDGAKKIEIKECDESVCESCPNDCHQEDTKGLLKCPECGELTLKAEAKCATCFSCGFSFCS